MKSETNLSALQCPNCGAPVSNEQAVSSGFVVCEYCNSAIAVKNPPTGKRVDKPPVTQPVSKPKQPRSPFESPYKNDPDRYLQAQARLREVALQPERGRANNLCPECGFKLDIPRNRQFGVCSKCGAFVKNKNWTGY